MVWGREDQCSTIPCSLGYIPGKLTTTAQLGGRWRFVQQPAFKMFRNLIAYRHRHISSEHVLLSVPKLQSRQRNNHPYYTINSWYPCTNSTAQKLLWRYQKDTKTNDNTVPSSKGVNTLSGKVFTVFTLVFGLPLPSKWWLLGNLKSLPMLLCQDIYT